MDTFQNKDSFRFNMPDCLRIYNYKYPKPEEITKKSAIINPLLSQDFLTQFDITSMNLVSTSKRFAIPGFNETASMTNLQNYLPKLVKRQL